MASVRKRTPNKPPSDRAGLCRATTRKGEPCRKEAVDGDRCLVHAGRQDMKELGCKGGRATPKAKRAGAQRQTLREFLRREVDPARVWAAIEAGRLAASKLLLTELYEPAAEHQREDEAEQAEARARLAFRLEETSRRVVLRGLVECGLIRPGGGRAFEGVVVFNLRELAEWAAAWVPRPMTVTGVTCTTCGIAGVRLVAEGEAVAGGPVYCETCRPEENGQP